AEDSIAELHELASSAGAEVVGQFLQRKEKPDPATLIGSGKLEEIAGAAASSQADLILFDHDLTPSQQRNIEKIVEARVIDRTQLILDIFARHAHTREGQLQVELAQLEYMLPRLSGRGVEMSQLGGGIGTRGPGETQLETDRRKIYRRVRHVKEQIENVRRIRAQQRPRRECVPRDVGGGAASGVDPACIRCQQSSVARAGRASRKSAAGIGGRREAPAAGDEQD